MVAFSFRVPAYFNHVAITRLYCNANHIPAVFFSKNTAIIYIASATVFYSKLAARKSNSHAAVCYCNTFFLIYRKLRDNRPVIQTSLTFPRLWQIYYTFIV